ncbi:MAG: cobalamin B12-binding domain-containing protein [Candidatus Omnitrophica bacterium]|nr:cobalamin B12-binding domain-containing protein [Candidatus Omnitrophota bacterium]
MSPDVDTQVVTEPSAPTHPLGSRATVLLTSVFGPYARDDEYGSRAINPMELYQNQVTRAEGPFSLRMFHRSWGLMLIQTNINAPCTLLDFPTLDRFISELKSHEYDVVGISAIVPNVEKVKTMCALVREHLPRATIVVGGHVANVPKLREQAGADHVVRGEGVRWFQRFLGEDATLPIRHPLICSAIGTRTMGIEVKNSGREAAATLIPSVGCPMGCNFCATSAMFGGKGKFINFYETGDELFHVMRGIERRMGVRSFFVMDENVLLHKKRALRLLELMEEHGKAWSLYVFSSARVVQSYPIEQLVRLGISWVWMGLEGKNSQYVKLEGIDTRVLVRTLQSHGIRILGSSIIGLEEHTPDNINEVIEHAISHSTDFHQFMLYTPIPGTALYAEHLANNTLRDPRTYHEGDIHGQAMFRHLHPHIPPGQEAELILRAFRRDFEVNGPSVLRIARTVLAGWRRYRYHPDPCVRNRFAWEARDLVVTFPATLWAARRWFREQNPELAHKLSELLEEITREVGFRARLVAPLAGRFVWSKLRQEAQRLKAGWTYEPPTFYEANAPMRQRRRKWARQASPIHWVAACRPEAC